MDLDQLIQIMENRISTLQRILTEAHSAGDIDRYSQIDGELKETQLTLEKLKSITKLETNL